MSTIAAKTVKQPLKLSGVGLHSGQTVNLQIAPAAAKTGIRFIRSDLPGRPSATASQFDHNAAPFRTVIKNGAAEIHTVEHLLSALAGLGITDCIVEIDGLEVPGMDGSSANFVEALCNAGVTRLDGATVAPLIVKEPVELSDGIAQIKALPHSGGLKITYTLDYPGHTLAQGTHEMELNETAYVREIAPARTFAIKKDAEAMRAAGLGKGANLQNTVVIEGDQAIETTLRFANEPVRHKILDLIGDLYVIQRPVHAHIIARCSGHKTNRMLAAKLAELYPLRESEKSGKNMAEPTGNNALPDINEIKKILPHRYPMLLVDRIIEVEAGRRIVGIKNVTANESFFQGHFPVEPIMPGVLILEALAQLSCVLVLRDLGVPGSIALFTGADNVSWRRKVVPGDQIRLEAEVDRLRVPFGRMKTRATVEGDLAAEATIKFMIQMPEKK